MMKSSVKTSFLSPSLLPLTLVLSILSLISTTRAVCYFPNGVIASQDTACRTDTAQSTCCGQGYACLSNNICMATGDLLQSPSASLYVRGSCTDQGWTSDACANFCVNPSGNKVDGYQIMGKCTEGDSSEAYYCGDSEDSDCEAGEDVIVFQGVPSAITTIGAAATASPSSGAISSTGTSTRNPTDSSSSVSNTATGSPGSGSSSNHNNSIGIGVGVGVGGAGLIAAVAAFWFLWRRRKQQKAIQQTAVMEQRDHDDASQAPSYSGHSPQAGYAAVSTKDTAKGIGQYPAHDPLIPAKARFHEIPNNDVGVRHEAPPDSIPAQPAFQEVPNNDVGMRHEVPANAFPTDSGYQEMPNNDVGFRHEAPPDAMRYEAPENDIGTRHELPAWTR